MIENLPPGTNIGHINEHCGSTFADWLSKNEDGLLEDFLNENPTINNVQVKDWPEELTKRWEDYCIERYAEHKERENPYE